MAWLGIDTGGTFTDFVWYSADDPVPRVVKVPTDAADPRGVLAEGLRRLSEEISDVDRLVLGTTLGTNTVLEGDGARVATVTTAGYRDIVEIGRQNRFEMYNLKTLRRKPLSPRRWRHELDERTEWDGTTLRVPTIDEIDAVARVLEADDIEAVAVCFLFSFVNDANERLTADRLGERGGWYVTASHEIVRQSQEYERFATTLLNAFVGPRMDRFLSEIKEYLEAVSVDPGKVFLISATGGAMTIDSARVAPVRTINSGPAGGAQASIELGRVVGTRDIITCDMGGTSTDVSLIKDLDAGVTSAGYLDRVPFVVPHLDLVTIGTGGGSIAWIDIGGELEVGPRSAGASPGPACYGRGGTEPTVTDANLVLGRLSEDRPLGGTVTLQRALAEAAVSTLLPDFDGMSVMDLSEGILRIAVARMATAVKDVSVARGLDPRDFTLVAFGGAGPMHATELARELGITRILIPPVPGNFSALGLVMSDVRHDFVQTKLARVMSLDPEEFEEIFKALEDTARSRLASEGFREEDVSLTRTVDMRYAGQWFDVNLPAPACPDTMGELDRSFREAHLARYQIEMDRPTEFVNFRVTARGIVHKPSVGGVSTRPWSEPALREIYLDGAFREVPVFDRLALPVGRVIEGPAILEEFGSTTVVTPGFELTADASGALVITSDSPAKGAPALLSVAERER